MSVVEIVLIAIALAMDCFAVSIVSGVICRKLYTAKALRMAFLFSLFQALMPLIGWTAIHYFQHSVEAYDHWIAFGLLFLIGANMIREAIWGKEEEGKENGALDFKTMLLLAIATSIDALAVGVSFACIQVRLWSSVLIIGLTTFVFSVLGVKIGNVFGSKYEKSAGIIGGIILILIGLKILLEHLGIISF